MRDNGQVSQRGHEVPAGTYLISRTDAKGLITYVNDAFVAISGFTREELLKSPHNLVRHPDMPPAAFADLWATIADRRCWVGVVKNRCKNGDHYWVRAAVSAEITAEGQIAGFISVRVRPTAQEVAAAEQAYAAIRSGSRGLKVRGGRVQSRNPLAALGRRLASISTQMAIGFAALVLLIGSMGWIGYRSMETQHDALEHMYSDRLICASQINAVSSLTRANWVLMARASLESDGQGIDQRIEANAVVIKRELDAYLATTMTAEEQSMAHQLAKQYGALHEALIVPGIPLVKQGKRIALRELLSREHEVLLDEVSKMCDQLVGLQATVGKQMIDEQRQAYASRTWLMIGLTALAVVVAVLVGMIVSIRLRRGFREAIHQLDEVSSGKFDREVNLDRNDEFGAIQRSVAVLQTRLGYGESRGRESRSEILATFDRTIGEVLANITSGVGVLDSTAKQQVDIAGRVSTSAQSVSSSATELSASIREIANQATSASELARTCAERTTAGVATMRRLTGAANDISGVVKVIGRVAEQTNLLALNASIEASSAGEAGRGFAVVAGEVKNLATQTTNATGDIDRKVAAVLSDTGEADKSLATIADAVHKLTDAANAIAAAVEQQAAVVEEVARSANQASEAAGATGTAATEVGRATTDLAAGSHALAQAVERFKAELKAK